MGPFLRFKMMFDKAASRLSSRVCILIVPTLMRFAQPVVGYEVLVHR